MDNFAQDLQEFLHSICDVVGDEAIELDEIAVRATQKFGARMKANKRVGKKLTPSKYLKKYGNRWHSLKDEVELDGESIEEGKGILKAKKKAKQDDAFKKANANFVSHYKLWLQRYHSDVDAHGFAIKKTNEETDQAPKEQDPKARKLGAGEIAYAYIKRKDKVDASKIRRVGIDGSLQSAESFDPILDESMSSVHNHYLRSTRGISAKKAKKEERLASNKRNKNRFRDLEAKREMKMSQSNTPHSSGHGVSESVKPAKGTKKDKRPDPVNAELPIMPAGMNAGMRMMAASFDDFKGDLIAELSKDSIYGAYKERAKLAKAHHDIGDDEGAKKHAEKALKHADYHKGHEESREKYAKFKAARETIAKRAKTPDPKAAERLALQKRREARKTLYGDRKKNENAQ